MLNETIKFLTPKEGGVYVDGTLGGGGHTRNLKLQNPNLKIYGFDLDEQAIAAAKENLKEFANIIYINDNFKNLKKHVNEPVDGILLDLGISSHQIDEAGRGFSIRHDGPLDMRMDKSQPLTAEKIVNNFKQEELQHIFREFGEERFAHRVAKAIIKVRTTENITSTQELKKIIEKAIPTWRKRESVTRIFQSLRIAVNFELDNLKIALRDSIDLLKPGGRLVVIAYHSLEDRIVKHALRHAAAESKLNILTKKPLTATDEEIALNRRAKSAKLRAAEKMKVILSK